MFKTILFAGLLLFTLVLPTYACEICGCSNNSFQIGILPNFGKGFMGVRYTSSRFNSRMKNEPSEYSHDFYQGTELWGGLAFKKWQIIGFIPYVYNRKSSDDGSAYTNGLGDAMVLVNYKIFSSTSLSKDESITLQQNFFVGGGIKLPTGKMQVNVNDPDFNLGDFNSQAGTGSVDFLLNLTHNMMWNKSGIVTNAAYRINTSNASQYHFGNRFYASSSFFYTLGNGNIKWKPNAGFNLETNRTNSFNGTYVAGSNGYTFSSSVGLNVLFGKVGLNAVASLPIHQNMYDGQTKLAAKGVLGLTYSF